MAFSRLFVYYMSRKVNGRIYQKGAELSTTLSVMCKYGVALHKTWPFRHSLVDKEPSPAAFAEAQLYKLISYELSSTRHFKDTLLSGIPIIIGLHTGRKFWTLKGPLETQEYCPINDTDNRRSLGHALTVVGFDDTLGNGAWIVANSLGLKWGDHGLGALPYSCSLDIGEAYTIDSFAGITTDRKKSKIDK